MNLLYHAMIHLIKDDISVTRRIYQWMFGGTEFSEKYFNEYTMNILIDSFKVKLIQFIIII